jgi:hypothetical protein
MGAPPCAMQDVTAGNARPKVSMVSMGCPKNTVDGVYVMERFDAQFVVVGARKALSAGPCIGSPIECYS